MHLFDEKPFIVGDLTSPLGSKPIQIIEDGNGGDTVQDGDHVSRWNWVMEWGDGCLKPSELEKLRRQGDPLSDAVVRFFNLKAGDDGLRRLEEYIRDTPEDEWDEDIAAFWKSVAQQPPKGVSATASLKEKGPLTDGILNGHTPRHSNGYRNGHFRRTVGSEKAKETKDEGLRTQMTPHRTIGSRNRRPPPTLAEGQAVFWRYSGDMFTALLHFSLAGGFASARIMSVLRETGYLTSPSRDATYRRLMETTQALVDFMGDMTPVTGRGWKSAVRVRLLHSQVRVRILDGKSRLKQYDVEKDGIPVNQEDLIATLGGFCIAPLWCERRLGVHLSTQEEQAFIAAWRHIGYYLGIDPRLLSTYFSTATQDGTGNASRTHRFFACIAFHLFSTREPPKDPYSTATYTILNAVSDRPPSSKTTMYHCELSRLLLGHGLADQLAIPRGTWRDRWAVTQFKWSSWITANFSRYYLARWELSRQDLFRRVITLIVAWQLGERRSKFTWKEEADHAKKVSELQELHKDKQDDLGEAPGLEMGIKVGKQVRWQARLLFGEMGVVLASLGLVSAYGAWKLAGGLFR